MIDHMGFAVADIDRAKNFYVNAWNRSASAWSWK